VGGGFIDSCLVDARGEAQSETSRVAEVVFNFRVFIETVVKTRTTETINERRAVSGSRRYRVKIESAMIEIAFRIVGGTVGAGSTSKPSRIIKQC